PLGLGLWPTAPSPPLAATKLAAGSAPAWSSKRRFDPQPADRQRVPAGTARPSRLRAARVLIKGQASMDHLGHQCSHAPENRSSISFSIPSQTAADERFRRPALNDHAT